MNMNTNDHDAEVLEHARQRAARAHTAGFDVDVDPRATDHLQAALDALADVVPPAGRARLSNDQLLGVANAHATIALAQAVQTSNAIAALQLGVPALEHDDKTSADPKTRGRIAARNILRATVRADLGLS